MIIVRPITEDDQDAFIDIAFTAGIGMTSMPKNRILLEERVQNSILSFQKKITVPNDETYLFVLEDTESTTIGGVCSILARTGKQSPLPFYQIKKEKIPTGINAHTHIVPTLQVVLYKNYWSEICSLYLAPTFRHGGLGKLLSLCRFLFIAAFPERFDNMIFAEMRGHFNDQGICTFWEGIGRHFVDTTFEVLMHHRDEGMIDLSQALPRHPIYMELLPKEVQESIGKVHTETQAALKMLLQEGFTVSDDLDICDGGPKIEARTKEIRSVRESRTAKVAGTLGTSRTKDSASLPVILTNNRLDFRACLSSIERTENGEVILSEGAAKALGIAKGDLIRYLPT